MASTVGKKGPTVC